MAVPTIVWRLTRQVLIAAALVCVGMTMRVAPQTRSAGGLLLEERFKRIELDENDPEVQEARLRKLAEPVFGRSSSRVGFSPLKSDNRFLVDLDERKLSMVALHYGASSKSVMQQVSKFKQINFDQPGKRATGFVVDYPSLNAQLRCYWAYDQRLAEAISELMAKAREAELESRASGQTSEKHGQKLDVSRQVSPSANSRPVFSEGNPKLGQLLHVRHQFKKGGRPCQLEVICFVKDDSEQGFAERFHSMQRVRRVCRARADVLVSALVVVRAGN